ncbi:nuclear polyadenylated RNA-binding protein NAB2, putative [Babesia caballi]|uniref:Nuclear polyadenylated RNA-binding protein NAB2, putative n=1 Tax=Babesia caballi TaxID=5871 RepID=A0AAV4LXT9_BABCB|nr:nuclear polyadenylated RNA-binding protein NAB2, putative [Babesia caballi]
MFDPVILQKLPVDWQEKIHGEFRSKLGLCISDAETAENVARFTWETLIGGVESPNWLAEKFKPHLGAYAKDFADWVLEFVGQALHHFRASNSAGDGSSGDALSLKGAPLSPGSSACIGSSASRDSTAVEHHHGHSDDCVDGESPSMALSDVSPNEIGSAASPVDAVSEASVDVLSSDLSSAEEGTVHGGSADTPASAPSARPRGALFGSGASKRSFWPSRTRHSASAFPYAPLGHGGFRKQRDASDAKQVDPLDDTLDNLIRKQKINKLQGREGAPFGVCSRSTKFSPLAAGNHPEDAASGATSPIGPESQQRNPGFIGNNRTISPSAGAFALSPGMSGRKVPKACLNFPNCAFGSKCRYVHPATPLCKNWPKCSFGPKCAFTHPPVPCKYNKGCTNPLCNYQHTQ